MTTETLPRPNAPVALDCPWCGEPVEVAVDSPTFRCAGCATEADFAPDPVVDAVARLEVAAA